MVIIGFGVIFTFIVLTILYSQRTRTDYRAFVQNGRELADIIRNLEDGQVVFLNDITPFDWDCLYVFGAYTDSMVKQERMGIDEHYLLRDPHDGTIYMYFLFENQLVARLNGRGYGYSILFDFSLADEQTPWLQAITANPSDNLDFFVTVHEVPGGSEIELLQFVEEREEEYTQIDMDVPEKEIEATENGNGEILPVDYSKYIGIWRGYAIAVFETLVITDVREDEMTFLFLNMMKADGAPDSVSSIYTMPIIDNQITLVEDRLIDSGIQRTMTTILTFHDDHISLLRVSGDDGEHKIEWTLRRLPR